MKRISVFKNKYFVILCILVGIIELAFITFVLLNLQSQSTSSLIGLFSSIFTVLTLIVLYQYASDTRRMAELQNESIFFPTVELNVYTKYVRMGDIEEDYELDILIKNPTKYPITIRLFVEIYWFNIQVNYADRISGRNLDSGFKLIIFPFSSIRYDVSLNDGRTIGVAKNNNLELPVGLWVDNIRSPYYMGIKYKADNGFREVDLTNMQIYYNLMFNNYGSSFIDAEPYNTYAYHLHNMTTQQRDDYIVSYIRYAAECAKKNTI